jgi:hypothetical protein
VTLIVVVALAGCGGGDRKAPKEPVRTETGGNFQQSPSPTGASGKAGQGRETTVRLDVPKGWSTPKPRRSNRIWPEPLKVLSSFAIARVPVNAACPKSVLERMPPDGVYVLVSEYTQPRPKGFPSTRKLGPRPDLRKLDLRPAEVECWDNGLSGQTDFAEHGRGFHVEVLLGARVTAAQRREALDALASLKIA